MSMLGEQIKELREGAKVYDHMIPPKTATLLREAADTIESLRDRLQGVMGTRYCELFGTPELAARTIADISERVNLDGIGGDYDALLEWLKGADE